MDDDLVFFLFLSGLCAAVIVGIFFFFCALHICTQPGTGQQIGYVSEIENAGILWRPVEIVLIGSEATFSSSQTSWEYASASPEITELARHYMKTHEKVIVKYESVMIVYAWEYSNPTRITSIEMTGDGA